MSSTTVDARGLVCPKPLILTKRALSELEPGETMTVLIDNSTSRGSVSRFLSDNGALVETHETGEFCTLTVRKGLPDLTHPDAEAYSASSGDRRPHVVCFRSDTMGSGDDDLGSILIKACANTIKEVSPLPSTVVCYNRGVLLAAEGSVLIDSLKELTALGVTVLVCGTCADYYGVKERIAVGTISNMYTILETLTAAGHVVTP